MFKFLVPLLSAISLLAQTAHLATTDDGSVLYFASTLRQPGAGQSMATKLFRIDSSGAHLIDDEGNVGVGAGYWNLSNPSVSGDGSRLVYTARVPCGCSTVCVHDELSTPRTPPGAPGLFIQTDMGGVVMSRNGRFAALYGTAFMQDLFTPTVVLIDFVTGVRTKLPGFAPAQITSSGICTGKPIAHSSAGSDCAGWNRDHRRRRLVHQR